MTKKPLGALRNFLISIRVCTFATICSRDIVRFSIVLVPRNRSSSLRSGENENENENDYENEHEPVLVSVGCAAAVR